MTAAAWISKRYCASAPEKGLVDADSLAHRCRNRASHLAARILDARHAVTEISGRGVGLDVVATRLRALSGSIDIRSRRGAGLTIELRFQASLVATHALFVRDGGQVFGIASHAVRRAVPAMAVELRRENGALFAVVEDTQYAGA